MAYKLKILVCECFHSYFQKIALPEFQDMEIINFSYPCISCHQYDGLEHPFSESMANYYGNSVLISGGYLCPAFKSIIERAVHVQVEKQDNCFSHLLGKTVVKDLIAQGGYLITELWVRRWKDHIEGKGLERERERAQRFYGEIARRIICISEGPENIVIPELEEFSRYLNLPFSIMKPDYSYIRDLLQHLYEDWKLKKNNNNHSNEDEFYRKQPADHMKIFEIIRKFTDKESVPEIISTIQEELSTLFSCKKVEYISASRKDISEPLEVYYSSFLRERKKYKVLDDNSGFLVKIEQGGKIRGILHLADFQFPANMFKYLNFILDIAGVIGLAISNSSKSLIIKEKEAEMEYIDTHDTMTGLFNRRFFDEKTRQFQQIEMKNGICIMVCDVDGLKQINDTRGHNSGDRVIKGTADILIGCFREGDILARIGGDEFAALIPDCTKKSVASLKKRLLDHLAEYNQKKSDMQVSFSVGFSHGYPSCDDLETLFRQADEMMYRAKREKKTATLEFLQGLI